MLGLRRRHGEQRHRREGDSLVDPGGGDVVRDLSRIEGTRSDVERRFRRDEHRRWRRLDDRRLLDAGDGGDQGQEFGEDLRFALAPVRERLGTAGKVLGLREDEVAGVSGVRVAHERKAHKTGEGQRDRQDDDEREGDPRPDREERAAPRASGPVSRSGSRHPRSFQGEARRRACGAVGARARRPCARRRSSPTPTRSRGVGGG